MDRGAVLRIAAGRRVVHYGERCLGSAKAPSIAWSEEREVLRRDLCRRAERRHVIEDPEPAAIGRDHQVAEPRLHDYSIDRRVRQVVLQRLPACSVVERDVESILGPGEEQSLSHRILGERVHVAERALRDAVHDARPAAPIVGRAKDPRIEVVDLMSVHAQIRRARRILGRDDRTHRTPRRHAGEPRGDIGPGAAAVARHLRLAVVGAGPDHATLHRRLGDPHDHPCILHADVVRRESTRATHPRAIIAREVGADQLPTLPVVARDMHMLTACVERLGIMRRDMDREVPLEAVLQLVGRMADRRLGPHLEIPREPGAQVVSRDDAAHRSVARCARPDVVRVRRVGRGEAALAASDRLPRAARDLSSRARGAPARVARPTR